MKVFVLLILLAVTAVAFEYETPLPNDQQEKLAQEIFAEVRCLVCDGESLAASNADFSVDMRALIREQIAAGGNKQQVLNYLTERYGAAILQAPPKSGGALLLWLMPLLLLVVGAFMIRRKAK